MKLTFCVACGAIDDLQHHHLVTRAEKGSDDETNLITLCNGCHLKLHERRRNGAYSASERTKAGIKAARERGVSLGNPNLGEAQLAAVAAVKAEADRFAETIRPTLAGLGAISANAMARALNERHIATASGGKWSASTVLRLQRRLKEISGRTIPA